jgi:hypothetical protein
VNKLRDALSDSADNPRFIQTIPRRGYRFIAPVEIPSPEIQPAGIPPETILNDTDLSEEQVQGRQARKTENDAEPFGAAEKRSLVLSDAQEAPLFAYTSDVSLLLYHRNGEPSLRGTITVSNCFASAMDFRSDDCDRARRNTRPPVPTHSGSIWISRIEAPVPHLVSSVIFL